MRKLVVGECFNAWNGFLCMEGPHQNYPCPYRADIEKCFCSIPITEEIVKAWEEKGSVQLTREQLKYDPLHARDGVRLGERVIHRCPEKQ